MVESYLSLGSNLGDPIEHILQAIQEIKNMPTICVLKTSSLYKSAPMGPQDQGAFINAVVLVETALSPDPLLNELQALEDQHGRQRGAERWGARTLDLDILLYGDEIVQSETLTIPHYGLKERYFVLKPLYEIAPELTLPCGTRLKKALRDCKLHYDLVCL